MKRLVAALLSLGLASNALAQVPIRREDQQGTIEIRLPEVSREEKRVERQLRVAEPEVETKAEPEDVEEEHNWGLGIGFRRIILTEAERRIVSEGYFFRAKYENNKKGSLVEELNLQGGIITKLKEDPLAGAELAIRLKWDYNAKVQLSASYRPSEDAVATSTNASPYEVRARIDSRFFYPASLEASVEGAIHPDSLEWGIEGQVGISYTHQTQSGVALYGLAALHHNRQIYHEKHLTSLAGRAAILLPINKVNVELGASFAAGQEIKGAGRIKVDHNRFYLQVGGEYHKLDHTETSWLLSGGVKL